MEETNNQIRRHIDSNPKTSGLALGQYKIKCPACSDARKKNRRDTPLSVNIQTDKIVYHCHHCNIKGLISRNQGAVKMKVVPKQEPKKINLPKQDTSTTETVEAWLKDRKISLETAEKSGCVWGNKNYLPVIGFTFASGEGVDAIKWRTANGKKDFWWENNATKLWGNYEEDSSKETIDNTVVITEGEMDMLAIKESFKDYNIKVYSVPNGSPNKITEGKVDPSEDGRFKYIWEDREKIEGIDRIILASDNDTAGDVLVHELSRRIGKAKCYRVDYKGHKDANELLIETDEATVRKQVLNAEPIPLHGLNNIDHYTEDFQSLYDDGKPQGISTGFDSVDKIFTLQTGYLYIVTGYAGEGKSAFIDQIVVNAGKNHNWKTCFASFEKPPAYHAVQLAQIITGKPFFEGHNDRMTQDEKDQAEAWINEHILFQDYLDGGLPTIDAVLEKCQQSILRYGTRILVIDPFNFIHSDKNFALETDMVSEMLTKVQLFCKQHEVLCFFIAHPAKPMDRSKKNVVNGLDIAKSMAWSTKADVGLTVYRGDSNVEIHCTKARWNWNARLGQADLKFNPVNGRYEEIEQEEDNFDWEF